MSRFSKAGLSRSLPTLRFARALFVTNLKAAIALRGSFLLSMAFMALNNLTFFVFWWALFKRVPHLRGWQMPEVMLMFGLTATSFGLVQGLAGGVAHLSRFIDEGELDPLLTQPKPTLLYAVGSRCQPSGFGDALSGLGFLLASGYVTWSSLPRTLFCLLAAACTFLATGIAFFSLAFWLRKTGGLSRQLWDFVITFSLYPEPLFGGALRLVLFTLLPAGFVAYLPVRVIRDAALGDTLLLGAGSLGFLLLASWIFGRGLRRYASGSRFGIFG